MDDLIYILIGVIWIVFSIIKGTQKNTKTPAGSTPNTPPGNKSTFEEMLEEWLPQMTEARRYEEDDYDNQPEVPVISSEDSSVYKSAYEPLVNKYEEFDYDVEIISLEELDEIQPSLSNYERYEQKEDASVGNFEQINLSESFDLRKAVIYSTILERPYV
jgi:hypothetical protein